MKTRKAALINLIVILSLLLQANLTNVKANPALPLFSEAGNQFAGIIRSRVKLTQPTSRARLDKIGVRVLKEGSNWALVLATETQMDELAKSGFEPGESDDLMALANANSQKYPWLVGGLQATMQSAANQASLQPMSDLTPAAQIDVLEKALLTSLSTTQVGAAADTIASDSDADGLTDTQETWWCTDKNKADSDSDGVSDFDEVNAAKDWIANRRSGPPASGKPFAGWPEQIPGCLDDDHDSVPDLAERWELGLNPNRESTDGDKFDDGQELFGLTETNYGSLPRAEDTFITSSMPGWVDPPGNHPLAAAYPEIQVDIVPSSLNVTLVTQVTTGQSHSVGESKTYSTTTSKGVTMGVGKEESHTVSEWQEVGNTQADSVERSTYQSQMVSQSQQYTVEESVGKSHETELGVNGSLALGATETIGASVSAEENAGVLAGALAAGQPEVALAAANIGVSVNASLALSQTLTLGGSYSERNAVNQQTTYSNTSGYEVSKEQGQSISYNKTYEQSNSVGAGKESSSATTFTEEQYQGIDVTNENQIATNQEWSTATSVDSSHAADLTFGFTLLNKGTDNARKIQNILLNIYIGDTNAPISTYAGVLTGNTCTPVVVNNLYPGDRFPTTGIATQCKMALTLDELKQIDQGAHMRVIVADYDYGDDEQFYQNAWGQGVIVQVDDDTWDGDENLDSYLIPTWGDETYQDVIKRYFPVTEYANGDILSVRSPEYNTAHEITQWNDYVITGRSWWNIYLSEYGSGPAIPLRDRAAVSESRLLMRFNKDADLDYYSDRVERKLGTDLMNANDHPLATLATGYYETRVGNDVTVQLAMQNFGTYPAFGIEAYMVTPDDSTTVTSAMVGIGGLIDPGDKILLTSRILAPLPIQWSATSQPITAGYFSGLSDETFTFTVNKNGDVGVTSGLKLTWDNGQGATGTVDIGSAYLSPTALAIKDGIQVGMVSGTVKGNEKFQVTAQAPRDVFRYTINREPFTKPMVVISYNTPDGNHRFIPTAQLSNIFENLAPRTAERYDAPDMAINPQSTFNAGADNHLTVQFLNPSNVTINGDLLVIMAESLTGKVAHVIHTDTTFLPGPNLYSYTWNTSQFSPSYDPNIKYKIRAYAFDQGKKELDVQTLQFDDLKVQDTGLLRMNENAWNAGNVQKGTVLTRTVYLANLGLKDLWLWSGQGAPVTMKAQSQTQKAQPGEMLPVVLSFDTSSLPAGNFSNVLPIRTSDPANPVVNYTISGVIVNPPSSGVWTVSDPYKPLEETVYVTGPQAQNQLKTVTSALPDETSRLPLYLVNNSQQIKAESQDAAGSATPLGGPLTVQSASTAALEAQYADLKTNLTDERWQEIVSGKAVELPAYGTSSSKVFIRQDGTGFAVAGLPPSSDSLATETESRGSAADGYFAEWTNYAQFGENHMFIGKDEGWGKGRTNAYIRFDLPGLPTNSYVTGASVQIYEYGWNTTQQEQMDLFRVTSGWDEGWTGRAWGSQPAVDWTVRASAWNDKTVGWKAFNIVGLAQDWYNGAPNCGFVIRDTDEGLIGGFFRTRENGSYVPTMYIDFGLVTPAAPTLNAISDPENDGSYRVSWSATGYTTGYNLQENINGAGWGAVYIGGNTFYDLSGKPSGTYCYLVRAENYSVPGGWSNQQCITEAPSQVTLYDISNPTGANSYTVDWSDVANVTSYNLDEQYNGGGWTTVYNAAPSVAAINGRASGTWCYRARGANSGGPGPWSGTKCTQVNQAPNAPVLLTPAANAGNLSRVVHATWQDGGDGDNYPWTSRQFQVKFRSEDNSWTSTPPLANATLADVTVPADGNYYWTARAYDGQTNSAWAGERKVTVYSLEKATSNQVKIALPETVGATTNQYQLTYGLKAVISAANQSQVVNVYLPKRVYSDASFTTNILNPGSTSGQLTIDLGNDGTDLILCNFTTGQYSFTPSGIGAQLTQYVLAQAGSGGSQVKVPIALKLNTTGTVYLSSFKATPGVDSDMAVTAAGLSASNPQPVEQDTVTLNANVTNSGIYKTQNVIVRFYAGDPLNGGSYIGSDYISEILGQAQQTAHVAWKTSGFTGSVPIYAVLDPANQITEMHEDNNTAFFSLNILTRPDLSLAAPTLSDTSPVVNQAVQVTVPFKNTGMASVTNALLRLYDGKPDDGGTEIGSAVTPLNGQSQVNQTFIWTPLAPGNHRIYLQADPDNAVNESDKSNNLLWMDVYVGFANAIKIDSGLSNESAYTALNGAGFIDEGQPDVKASCGTGTLPSDTFRQDPGGNVIYRFDHLLPEHYYHLDLTLFECDGAGRLESVYIDGIAADGPEDLGDALVHKVSIRIDPALYADHTITVETKAEGIDGAVLSQVNLLDIDYRYADAGGSKDVAYPGARQFGYLDGTAVVNWGTLPYQTVRVDQSDSELRYRFDNLNPLRHYNLLATFWQPSGTGRIQKVQFDGVDSGTTVNLGDFKPHLEKVAVPQSAYASDGSLIVGIVRTNATTGAMVNEIALEEETISVENACAVSETPYFSEVYGSVTINNVAAPAGTVVQAQNPRGDTVGCFEVAQSGQYGFLRIFGEDTSAFPPIAGMRNGETVSFKVNGASAVAAPPFSWQNDSSTHLVNLNAGSIVGQSVLLQPGWNLISFNVEPANSTIALVLSAISGHYDRVLGETGTYIPSLPDQFNLLRYMNSQKGYYLRVTGTTSVNLQVDGVTIPQSQPISLHRGWNWMGGPTATLPISTALQTIQGHYQRVLSLSKTYDSALPQFSTLTELKPGEGYLIFATDAVTLTYPASGGQFSIQPQADNASCDLAAPTPDLTLFYGQVKINGKLAPVGTKVTMITPDGTVAGCSIVTQPGQLNLTQVYGSGDSSIGFADKDKIRFAVNGMPVGTDAVWTWSNDREPKAVTLAGDNQSYYLPYLLH